MVPAVASIEMRFTSTNIWIEIVRKRSSLDNQLTYRPSQLIEYPVSLKSRIRPSHPTKIPMNRHATRTTAQAGIHSFLRPFLVDTVLDNIVRLLGSELPARVRTRNRPSIYMISPILRPTIKFPAGFIQEGTLERRQGGYNGHEIEISQQTWLSLGGHMVTNWQKYKSRAGYNLEY
jgi:hypothetical protein